MFPLRKSKNIVNLVIEDYVIRMVENNGKDLSSMKLLAEKVLPTNVIDDGKIVDEVTFYECMKDLVDEWDMKGKSIRFYVPHSLIIMREINITEPVIPEEVKQYITMEIGHTIHFPFNNPLFDIYHVTGEETVDKVTIVAAPEDEVMKYTNIFYDVKLKPIAIDVQALGAYRYFYDQLKFMPEEKVYLFLEFNLTSVNISIFNRNYMEFLRYQALDIAKTDWQPSGQQPLDWMFTGNEQHLRGLIIDQLNELERIMNFYQFSIHQGQQSVTNIVVLGDMPDLRELITPLSDRYMLPVTILSVDSLLDHHPVSPAFIPALGLAIKGGAYGKSNT